MTVKRTPHAGGVARLTAALRELDGVQAKTGWFETAKYEDGTPVAYIASIHEFGAPGAGIPARPFMRPTVAEKREAWMRLLEGGATEVLRGNVTASTVLETVAMRAAGDIAKAIKAVTAPPLSQLTLAARAHAGPNGRIKGGADLGVAARKYGPFNVSTKPLVWTGQMIQSVTGIVESAE